MNNEIWLVPSGDAGPDNTLIGSTLSRLQACKVEWWDTLDPIRKPSIVIVTTGPVAFLMQDWLTRNLLPYIPRILAMSDALDTYTDVTEVREACTRYLELQSQDIEAIRVFTDSKHYVRYPRTLRSYGFRKGHSRGNVPPRTFTLFEKLVDPFLVFLSFVDPRGGNLFSRALRAVRKRDQKTKS